MPVFEYSGLTEGGKSVRGLKDAESRKVLRSVLRKDGIFLTDARSAEGAAAVASAAKVEAFSGQGLSREVDLRALFGSRVSAQDLAISTRLLAAMLYPAVMVLVGVVIVSILFVVVIPKVTKIFEDMNVALPWTTRILIATSSFARDYWYALLVGLPLAAWGLRRWIKTPKGRDWWDAKQLTLPIFGELVRMLALGRFAKTLATLLSSGVPLLTALDIVKNIVHNSLLASVIEDARDAIREGESIAAPLKRSGQFPPLVHHMIAIGEKSGQLEEMLQNVARSYDAQVEMRVGALTSLLEPIMIVAMGGGVAFIVFSILMPIMQLTSFVPK